MSVLVIDIASVVAGFSMSGLDPRPPNVQMTTSGPKRMDLEVDHTYRWAITAAGSGEQAGATLAASACTGWRADKRWEASTTSLVQSTAQGMSLNVTLKGGRRDVVGVVPDTNASIRVRTQAGAIRTVPVIDGVGVVSTGERHNYIRGL
jgi:hypothetical protein